MPLLIILPAQGMTPDHQYNTATVIDSFSTLKLDEAILPDSESLSKHTDHIPRVGTPTSAQSGRRGPSLPVSPSQGLPTRSPTQDHIYPGPSYDDLASYEGNDHHPNNVQYGAQTAHQYWNDSAAYPPISYNATDPASHYHQSPHSQTYPQQREYPKEMLIRHF